MVQVVCTGCGAVEQLHGSLREKLLWKLPIPNWLQRRLWPRPGRWLCINTRCYNCLRAAEDGALPASLPGRVCRKCGCTDDNACTWTEAGFGLSCVWVERDLCSRCA